MPRVGLLLDTAIKMGSSLLSTTITISSMSTAEAEASAQRTSPPPAPNPTPSTVPPVPEQSALGAPNNVPRFAIRPSHLLRHAVVKRPKKVFPNQTSPLVSITISELFFCFIHNSCCRGFSKTEECIRWPISIRRGGNRR